MSGLLLGQDFRTPQGDLHCCPPWTLCHHAFHHTHISQSSQGSGEGRSQGHCWIIQPLGLQGGCWSLRRRIYAQEPEAESGSLLKPSDCTLPTVGGPQGWVSRTRPPALAKRKPCLQHFHLTSVRSLEAQIVTFFKSSFPREGLVNTTLQPWGGWRGAPE